MEAQVYSKERREYPRVYMDLPLDYWVRYDPRTHGGIVIDASETGFLIYSTEDIPIGTRLRIDVLFPRDHELANFEVFAEVIWKKEANKRDEGYQYGIKFNQISQEDYSKLRQLLIERLLND
jgi:c-di-GMP-binding flagellar brake protein YcgR